MPKKRVNGVFLEILPTTKKYSAWEEFYLHTKSEKNDATYTNKLNTLKQEYLEMINDEPFINKLKEIAQKEIEIIQHHCIINPHLIVGLFNQYRNGESTSYVIVRAPFYSTKQDRREIRVYMKKLSDYNGKTIEDLKKDTDFMDEAKRLVKKAMMEEMENIIILNTIRKLPQHLKLENNQGY